MKHVLRCLSLCLACLSVAWGCKEEWPDYPPVRTELAEVVTTSKGEGKWLRTDQGEAFRVQEGRLPIRLRPDTLYRMLVVFEVTHSGTTSDHSGEARIYRLTPAVSGLPTYGELPMVSDPLVVRSATLSSRYLNVVILEKGRDKPHHYQFTATRTGLSGRPTEMTLTIVYDRLGDYPAFTQVRYLSIPLWPYAHVLTRGSQLRLRYAVANDRFEERIFTISDAPLP